MTSIRHLAGTALSAIWGLATTGQRTRTQVLMFHSVGGSAAGDTKGLYSIDPDNFRSQMMMLKELDGKEVNLVPFGQFAPGSLSITFDDGYKDNLTTVAPIMHELEIPFHIFLCPAFIDSGTSGFLTQSDVRYLQRSTLSSFGVHGYSHTPLTSLDTNTALAELADSRKWLEDLVQTSLPTMSYPHGAVNKAVREMVESTGFQFAASSKFGPLPPSHNPFMIPRIDVWSSDTPSTLISKIKGNWDWMKWRT
jgi:peptidoglycan/xylan/chitin deacetylase (PgdA/CDA1 family)